MPTLASILVIDDDPLIRMVASEILEAGGYAVRVAVDGGDGLRQMEAEAADLVITDVLMPDKDGLEVTRHVKARWPGVPIIAISSGGRVDAGFYLPLARAMGVEAVMQKPLRPAPLLTLVGEVLAGIGDRRASA